MTLSDHLRPLLRDHDCVIIPDFGGLVAEYTSAKVQPAGRHLLSPPTRQVAFNQALTRNDGLLLDALRQHLGLSAAEAREYVRQAVAMLHYELKAQQRTELPGIGVFRQQAGRGLQFEYTGTENLLAAAFGLPELMAQPVAVSDARLAREQQAQLVPRLRSVANRSSRVPLRQLLRGGAIGLAAGVMAAAVYLLSLHPTVLPVALQSYVPRWEQLSLATAPQQATLAHTGLGDINEPSTIATPAAAPGEKLLEELAATPTEAAATPKELVEMPTVVLKKTAPAAALATAPAAPKKEVAAPAAPVAVAAKPAASKPVVSLKDSKAVVLATAKPAALAVAKAPATTAAVATTAAPTTTTIKARTGRFYIMVAAYSSLARAEEGRRNLAHAGRPAKVILPFPGTRYYRLTAADFAGRTEALAAAARLRQNPKFDQGISVFPY